MEAFAARTKADVGGEDSSSGVPERREIHARCNMHGHAVRQKRQQSSCTSDFGKTRVSLGDW